MAKQVFKEEQKFRRWDVLGLVIALMAMLSYRVFAELWNSPSSQGQTLLLSVFMLLVLGGVLVFLLNIRLFTKIGTDGIRYQYYPFHYKQKKVLWKDIAACELVQTPALAELSGWAVSFDNKERFVSVSGRTGLRLTLKSGRQIFIGTCHLPDLEEAMAEIKTALER